MAQSLTSLTATQKSDNTYRVDFGFNAVNATNLDLALTYFWKKQSDSTYLPATTTAPATVTAVSGGTAVAGTWDLDADFTGSVLAVPLTLQVTSTAAAIAATGSLTAVAANASTGIKEADYFTIGSRVYEFTTDATIVAGRVPVTLATSTDSAALVKAAIIAAINGDTSAIVTAASGAGQLINLTAKTAGVAGNITVTQSISNSATLTPVGLTGGVDPVVVSATYNITADTGTGDLPLVIDVPNVKHDFHDKTIEGPWDNYGAVAQGNMFGSYAKKVLNVVAAGTTVVGGRKFARIYGDRNLNNERAVLVNPTYWAANQGSNTTWNVVVKPISWFTDVVSRTLSNDAQWAGNTIFAISSTKVSNAASASVLVQQPVVLAYLMSAAQFESTIL